MFLWIFRAVLFLLYKLVAVAVELAIPQRQPVFTSAILSLKITETSVCCPAKAQGRMPCSLIGPMQGSMATAFDFIVFRHCFFMLRLFILCCGAIFSLIARLFLRPAKAQGRMPCSLIGPMQDASYLFFSFFLFVFLSSAWATLVLLGPRPLMRSAQLGKDSACNTVLLSNGLDYSLFVFYLNEC